MNNAIRDYLHFSKSQRRGILLLFFLILLVILTDHFLPYLSDEQGRDPEMLNETLQEHEALLLERVRQSASAKQRDPVRKVQPYPFDPNEMELKDWERMGLSKKQAAVIMNYRKQGGNFRVKSDVKKMYTISEAFYAKIEDYILLPDRLEKRSDDKHRPKGKGLDDLNANVTPMLIDLNTADSIELLELYGIGPVFAGRIVSFREALGGFYKLDQLKEVWGLKDSTVEKLKPKLTLKSRQLSKLNINTVGLEKLKAHPYLSWQEARAIVNYRKQHGNFRSLEDLKKIYALKDSLIIRLEPYLQFD